MKGEKEMNIERKYPVKHKWLHVIVPGLILFLLIFSSYTDIHFYGLNLRIWAMTFIFIYYMMSLLLRAMRHKEEHWFIPVTFIGEALLIALSFYIFITISLEAK